jgi:hypothetical protein
MNREADSTQGTERRQAYRKPKLRRIELVTGEVLGLGCKMIGGGPAVTEQTDCGLVVSCNQSGS